MHLSHCLPLLADWMLKSVVVLGLAWPAAGDAVALKMPFLPPNAACTPLFTEREAKTGVRISPGQVVVLRLGERKAIAPAVSGDWAAKALPGGPGEDDIILVFLSAKEAFPFDVPVNGKPRAASPSPPGTTITEVPYDPAPFRT